MANTDPTTGPIVDVTSTIDEYLDRSDWRVNANANQDYSLGGMMLNTSGKVVANYWLSNVFSPEAGAAHRDGSIHIHDLDMLAGYCAGWSLRQLLEEGFNGVPGTVTWAGSRSTGIPAAMSWFRTSRSTSWASSSRVRDNV